MQKLRRWAAAALCGAAFAGSAAAVLAACAVCPGRAWIVRGALFLQDPAAAAAIAWPADAARAAYKPQKPDRRPTPVPKDAGGLKNRMDESTNTGTLTSSQGLRRPQRVRVRSDR